MTVGSRRFCGQECADKGRAIAVADTLPAAEVTSLSSDLFSGACPVCNRVGKAVDIRYHHRLATVWLYLVRYERRSTEQLVSCRACAAKEQLSSLAYTFLLGWWSPRGLFLTPVTIGQNLYELAKLGRKGPSKALKSAVAIQQAESLIAKEEPVSRIDVKG